jgi:aryl-alcohol dehydrogenase-like predicted oxidoreductase
MHGSLLIDEDISKIPFGRKSTIINNCKILQIKKTSQLISAVRKKDSTFTNIFGSRSIEDLEETFKRLGIRISDTTSKFEMVALAYHFCLN